MPHIIDVLNRDKEREQSKIQTDHKAANGKLQKADADLNHLTNQLRQKKADLRGTALHPGVLEMS
jgi:hypothetical protein